jgi:hypothetical protein
VNQFPAFIAIPAANPCDLPFLKEDLQKGFGFLGPVFYARPVPIDALQRFIRRLIGVGNVDLADCPENLPTFEAEIEVARETTLRETLEGRQENFLIDFGECGCIHTTTSIRRREYVQHPT